MSVIIFFMRWLIKLIQKTYRMVGPLEGSRVLHNVTSLSGLQIITYLLPVFILPYLFRAIGPDKFGLISFAQAFVQYFMILTDYGFSVSATREISLCHEDREKVSCIISSVMTIKTALMCLSLLVLWAVIAVVPRFHHDWMVYALSFGTVIGNTLFPSWFFQGAESMRHTARINIIGQFFCAAGIFIFVHGPDDYLAVPCVMSLSAIITGIWGQYILLTCFDISLRLPKCKDLCQQLSAGWNVFISVVAINAYTSTRVFAVGLLTNNTLTGFYSIAERIANAVQTFPLSSFTQAVFPRLSKIFHKNKTKAFEIMRQMQLITIIVSLVFLPLTFMLADFIVRVICGGDYPQAVLSLRFLLISVLFISSNAFRVQFLLVCGKTESYSKIHITMAAIGLPLIVVLIYYFSYVGAAMATAVIEAGVFMLTYWAIQRLKLTD